MQYKTLYHQLIKSEEKRYSWLVVGLLWLICFFNYADRQAIFSVFPLLQQEMHLSTLQLGLLGSSFAWIYGLGGPIAGMAVDRFRRKTAILGGLQFWSIICAATALSRTFGQLLLFRTAEGLGETVYYPASVSMLSDYHGPKTRSRALGLMQTSVYAGTVGGGYLAAILAERHGWRFPFAFLGGLGCLLGLVLLKFLHEPERGAWDPIGTPLAPARSLSETFQTLRVLLHCKTVLLLMAVFVAANFVAMVQLTWMPAYLHSRFHLGLGEAALDATVLPQIASILGAIFGGSMADYLAQRTIRGRMLVQTGALLVAIPFVVIAGEGSFHQVLGAMCVWGFCKGAYDANIFASAFDFVLPSLRGTTSGLMNCFGWLLGAGTAPIAIGLLATRYSLGFAVSLSASVYGFVVILLCIGMAYFAPHEALVIKYSQTNSLSRP